LKNYWQDEKILIRFTTIILFADILYGRSF